jgi:Arylsulfotransferase (ASST)
VNLDGDVVHRIRVPAARCAFGLPFNKDFLVMSSGKLFRVDWNSNVVWESSGLRLHHDFAIDGDGNINVLAQKFQDIQHRGKPLPISDHGIVTLSPDGVLLRTLWMSEILQPYVPVAMLDSAAEYLAGTGNMKAGWNNPTDLFHLNTITFLDRDRGNTRAGNVLLCSRHLDSLFAIDLKTNRVTWRYGAGILEGPHHPTQVGDHLLLLDNGIFRGHSRILEIEPEGDNDAEIHWQYEQRPDFFTASRGSVQRLRNGNHFIAQADSGRLFEIAPDNTIVWEYWNPNIIPAKKNEPAHRRLIYRAYRLTPEDVGAPEFRKLVEGGLTRAERQQRQNTTP